MRIYLDFDGVLHAVERFVYRIEYFEFVPPLEDILRKFPHVQVVVSSSWREDWTLEQLRENFSPDIRERIIGVTPRVVGKKRVFEIKLHLKQTKYTGPFIVIDDAPFEFPKQWLHLIVCDSEKGFDEVKQKELIMRLQESL